VFRNVGIQTTDAGESPREKHVMLLEFTIADGTRYRSMDVAGSQSWRRDLTDTLPRAW
jgi:hypothetical protein